MNIGPDLLAFLEREMEAIVADRGRDQEARRHASAILGRVRGELEWNLDQREAERHQLEERSE